MEREDIERLERELYELAKSENPQDHMDLLHRVRVEEINPFELKEMIQNYGSRGDTGHYRNRQGLSGECSTYDSNVERLDLKDNERR